MSTASVVFAFRDKITQVVADYASKALRNEIDYRSCCVLPRLTAFLAITPAQMNAELETLVARGYLSIRDETAYPTWKALRNHPDFKGLSMDDARAIVARLKMPASRT